RRDALQVRVAFEEDYPLDELVGVMHLLDGLRPLLARQLGVAPVLQDAEMHPVLVHRAQLKKQRLVEPLDDLCLAFHADLRFVYDAWQKAAGTRQVVSPRLMPSGGGTLPSP